RPDVAAEPHLLASVDEVGAVMLVPTRFGEDADGCENVFERLGAAEATPGAMQARGGLRREPGGAPGGGGRRAAAARRPKGLPWGCWWPLPAPWDVTIWRPTASNASAQAVRSCCAAGHVGPIRFDVGAVDEEIREGLLQNEHGFE